MNRDHAAKLNEANLLSLRFSDPEASRCLFSSNQAVLYGLAEKPSRKSRGRWERLPIEGPLFVVERNYFPFYQLVIQNKKSLQNFEKCVSEDTKLEVIDHFLYIGQKPLKEVPNDAVMSARGFKSFRPDSGGEDAEVICIWFYDENAATQCLKLLQRISAFLKTISTPPLYELPKRKFDEADALTTTPTTSQEAAKANSASSPTGGAALFHPSVARMFGAGAVSFPELGASSSSSSAPTAPSSAASALLETPGSVNAAGSTTSAPTSSSSLMSADAFDQYLRSVLDSPPRFKALHDMYLANPQNFLT